jgi:hypothetical protein
VSLTASGSMVFSSMCGPCDDKEQMYADSQGQRAVRDVRQGAERSLSLRGVQRGQQSEDLAGENRASEFRSMSSGTCIQ